LSFAGPETAVGPVRKEKSGEPLPAIGRRSVLARKIPFWTVKGWLPTWEGATEVERIRKEPVSFFFGVEVGFARWGALWPRWHRGPLFSAG